MGGKAQPITIGPFAGGINSLSDPAAIADDECADLLNFDLRDDGSLVSRPPFVRDTGLAGNARLRYLGNYTAVDFTVYLIFSATPTKCLAYNTTTKTFITITTTFAATAMVQYDLKCWLIAPLSSANAGGFWDSVNFTAVAAMPKGSSAVAYKERLFISTGSGAKGSRVYLSNSTDFTKWTGTDFFDVNTGDGQDIIKMYSYAGSIAIFKQFATYIFAYDSNPAKGQVQLISASIGIDGPDCLTEINNILYVMCSANVYSITSWTWEQINANIPFVFVNRFAGVTSSNLSLSTIGTRVICRYYDTYYVFSTTTGVWTRWTTTLTPDNFIRYPLAEPGTGLEVYYAGNYLSDVNNTIANGIYKFKDGYDSTSVESFNCTLITKSMSMSLPYAFKRLMWWGVDVLAGAPITARVMPIVYGVPVKWKDVTSQNLTWAARGNYTWAAPLSLSLDVTGSADIKNYTNIRMFLRFIKSLRFRQLQFRIDSTVDGTTKTGPLNVFSITAFVVSKETVTKDIN